MPARGGAGFPHSASWLLPSVARQDASAVNISTRYIIRQFSPDNPRFDFQQRCWIFCRILDESPDITVKPVWTAVRVADTTVARAASELFGKLAGQPRSLTVRKCRVIVWASLKTEKLLAIRSPPFR